MHRWLLYRFLSFFYYVSCSFLVNMLFKLSIRMLTYPYNCFSQRLDVRGCPSPATPTGLASCGIGEAPTSTSPVPARWRHLQILSEWLTTDYGTVSLKNVLRSEPSKYLNKHRSCLSCSPTRTVTRFVKLSLLLRSLVRMFTGFGTKTRLF